MKLYKNNPIYVWENNCVMQISLHAERIARIDILHGSHPYVWASAVVADLSKNYSILVHDEHSKHCETKLLGKPVDKGFCDLKNHKKKEALERAKRNFGLAFVWVMADLKKFTERCEFISERSWSNVLHQISRGVGSQATNKKGQEASLLRSLEKGLKQKSLLDATLPFAKKVFKAKDYVPFYQVPEFTPWIQTYFKLKDLIK